MPRWALTIGYHREHIYRRHQRKTVECPRCLSSFPNQEKLDEHHRDDNQCEKKTPTPEEEVIYITHSQWQDLRKKKQNMDEPKRWFDCFRIIFSTIPDDELPSSPCKPKTTRRESPWE